MTEHMPCAWAMKTAGERAYHDAEWGKPVHDDRLLFEMLILEGAQAGLSWSTILAKRDGYRAAFDHFDARRIAAYTDTDRERLMNDAGIVRNRLKINAAITNAQAYLRLCAEEGSLDAWLWQQVDGQPVVNRWTEMKQIPARTELSDRISKALAKRGFKFVGSTIIYAYLQAVGVVNDHLVGCPARGA